MPPTGTIRPHDEEEGSVPGLPRFRMAVLSVAAVLVTLAGACSSSHKAPTISPPQGFRVVSDDDSQFAIAVPSDWELLPLNPKTFNHVAGDIRARNPKLASSLQQARSLADQGGAKLLAIQSDASSSVNLIVAAKRKGETFQSIPGQAMNQLREAGATDLARETVTLAREPAVRVTFKLPVATDNGNVITDEVQYYLLRGRKAFILTLAGPNPKLATVADSLRFN